MGFFYTRFLILPKIRSNPPYMSHLFRNFLSSVLPRSYLTIEYQNTPNSQDTIYDESPRHLFFYLERC